MKKSVRKSLFIIIVFSFLFMLFAGCSTSSGGDDNSNGTQSGTTQTPGGSGDAGGDEDGPDDSGEPDDDDGNDSENVNGNGNGESGNESGNNEGEDISQNTNTTKEVLFGYWPQTIKADDVEINESDSKVVGAFTYYKGNDGEWYAKAKQNDFYGSSGKNKYSNGAVVGSSGDAYFKVEPIKWKVIYDNYYGEGKKILLADKILFWQQFYTYDSYYENIVDRTINGKTVYANNYKYSKIRAYLNGLEYEEKALGQQQTIKNDFKNKGFLQTAFTVSQQASILINDVHNSATTTTDSNFELEMATDFACETTFDKIFLLSEAEVTEPEFGFSEYDSYGEGNTRIKKATDFAKANGLYLGNLDCAEDWWGGCWCLRSPSNVVSNANQHLIRGVGVCGDADIDWCPNDWATGIVPALVVDYLIENPKPRTEVQGKHGKYEKPYEIGDIVFNDGSAIPYEKGLSLNWDQKSSAVAIIVYAGGNENLGDKPLGVGLTADYGKIWADSSALGYNTKIAASEYNGIANMNLIKQFSDYSAEKYPAVWWADHYGDSNVISEGWYLPAYKELEKVLSLYEEYPGIFEALDKTNPFALEPGDCIFWTSSAVTESDSYYSYLSEAEKCIITNNLNGKGYNKKDDYYSNVTNITCVVHKF